MMLYVQTSNNIEAMRWIIPATEVLLSTQMNERAYLAAPRDLIPSITQTTPHLPSVMPTCPQQVSQRVRCTVRTQMLPLSSPNMLRMGVQRWRNETRTADNIA